MRYWIICLACLFIAPAWAEGLPAPVIKALRDAGIPQDAVGVMVQKVDGAEPLIMHNASRAMNPASTMKLLTTSAALELLGPSYTWHTDALSAANLQDGVLDGDLIIKGYGDPALTLDRFWALLHDLRIRGVREIRGDLILDNSFFEVPLSDPGEFDGQSDRAYNALPDALLVNFKAISFTFRPSAGRVELIVDPALPQLHIINQIQVVSAACGDWNQSLTRTVQHEGQIVTVTFAGRYASSCGEKSLELSLFDGNSYTAQLFSQYWQEMGGSLKGTVKVGSVPPHAHLLAQAVSLPMADVIRLVNKNSNNVMARQILLTLGAEQSGMPGNVDKGAAAIHAWLTANGGDFNELVIENGAGLSRNERISTQHLGELLLRAWRHAVMSELMSSLPIAGVDGTMALRLRNTSSAGQAHIKTGSLDGVKSMAGYVLDAQGRRWVVVFMVNHVKAAASREAMDALLEWVYRQK
ncbi:MAG TPA: D-alanyl-D-alanine carboxypeptidase/D-alanyl-D-alanine-endopeptidase [Methylophilaceae bacterium]